MPAGDSIWGKTQPSIDRPGFWPGLTDEQLELVRTKYRGALTEKQRARADREAAVRAERKAKKKQPKPPKKRRRKSKNRFVGEGEYNRYGKRIDDLRGEFTVGASRAGGPKLKPVGGGSAHSHSFRTTVTRSRDRDEQQIVRKCRCGRTEQWLAGKWELLEGGRP